MFLAYTLHVHSSCTWQRVQQSRGKNIAPGDNDLARKELAGFFERPQVTQQ